MNNGDIWVSKNGTKVLVQVFGLFRRTFWTILVIGNKRFDKGYKGAKALMLCIGDGVLHTEQDLLAYLESKGYHLVPDESIDFVKLEKRERKNQNGNGRKLSK